MHPRFNIPQLLNMLTWARPVDSVTERAFCREFIRPLKGAYVDTVGNWHVQRGDSPKVLWSCHTDTVHRKAGRQTLHYNPSFGVVRLSKRSKAEHSCLGADDTAGVAILVQMAATNIPGHYIFHYGEEVGGLGSDWLAKYHGDWLKSFDMAIALDRKGHTDVITHQGPRCCSDAFGDALADALNVHGLKYSRSAYGSFTDTANYTDHIGECTNLSIGYTDAHRDCESLDVEHVSKLFTALCNLDTGGLTLSREAGAPDPDYKTWTYVGKTDWKGWPDDVVCRYPETMRECINCSRDFDYITSQATEFDAFCSPECERIYSALFLDKAQAQAQAATLAYIKRRVM